MPRSSEKITPTIQEPKFFATTDIPSPCAGINAREIKELTPLLEEARKDVSRFLKFSAWNAWKYETTHVQPNDEKGDKILGIAFVFRNPNPEKELVIFPKPKKETVDPIKLLQLASDGDSSLNSHGIRVVHIFPDNIGPFLHTDLLGALDDFKESRRLKSLKTPHVLKRVTFGHVPQTPATNNNNREYVEDPQRVAFVLELADLREEMPEAVEDLASDATLEIEDIDVTIEDLREEITSLRTERNSILQRQEQREMARDEILHVLNDLPPLLSPIR